MKSLYLFVALAAFQVYAEPLDYGTCKAFPQSKKYITSNFQQPYPKSVVFTCVYECEGNSGSEEIVGTSEIRVASVRDDGLKVVCQGVKVKFTGVYYKFMGTKPFYSFDAVAPEIKAWAFENINRDNPIETRKLTELKATLNAVGASYISVGSKPDFSYFRKAGEEFLDIARGLPSDTHKLDSAIKAYAEGPSTFSRTSKEGIMRGFLKASASFRIK